MSDVVQRAAEAGAKIAELQKKRADLEASALAHEDQARADRRAMTETKREIAEWTAALTSLNVQRAVESAAQSAAAHEQKTAAALADVEKMRAELAALLAAAKVEKKDAPPAA